MNRLTERYQNIELSNVRFSNKDERDYNTLKELIKQVNRFTVIKYTDINTHVIVKLAEMFDTPVRLLNRDRDVQQNFNIVSNGGVMIIPSIESLVEWSRGTGVVNHKALRELRDVMNVQSDKMIIIFIGHDTEGIFELLNLK